MSEGYDAKDAPETTHTTNTSDSAKADEIEALQFGDIFRAAIKGSLSAVQHFLRLDPQCLHSTNAAGFTILHEAARHGHNDLAQLLLQKAASVNATTHTRETPLHEAAMKGYVALAEQLLAARACIDAKDDQGYDAYTFATINDQRPMKRLLRPVDAVINNCGDLAEAARDGNVEAAEYFVKVSPESIHSKDIFGLTPLHDAAERGYPGVAKVLLEARASIHDKTNTSRTPLHWTAENGHPSVAKLLLEARADAEAKNQWGLTPLHETAREGHAGVAQLLLPAGADIEAKDGWGRTPLHWAPQLGHLSVAQLLLGHNADLGATDRECLTPLHFAAQSGRCDAVEMLLDQNADASVQDRAGDTPYDKAESNGHHKVMELLGSIHVALPHGRSVRCRRASTNDVSSRSRSSVFGSFAEIREEAEQQLGQRIAYMVTSDGKLLCDEQTLAEAMISAGDTVTAVPATIHVALPSGRSVCCAFGSFAEIREEAKQQLGQRIAYMVTSDGKLLCDEQTLAEAKISAGDTVTAVAVQPLVMFALYETHENDVYEKMLAVEQCLTHRGVNTILHHERKTQSELNEDLERLKKANGVLLHVASAGFELERCHELNYALDNDIETLCLKTEEQYLPEHRKDTKKGERVGPVERMLAAADVVNCVGLTAEDIAMQLLKHVTAPKSPTKSQVFVSLLSGKTCGCIYYEDRSIKELKEEAEQELGVTIQHLIGSSMEPLTESEHFEEANILPNSTVTAIIAAAQPPVMFALYKTHEKDVYEKMLAVEQSLMRSGVNAILHDKRKTQSELNKDLERLKSKKGVLLHVASAGFTENTDLESCHELKYALDNNIETLCLKTEEQYSPEHRKDTKKGQSAGPVESMLAAADVVNCVGLTAEDIAKQLANHVTAPKKGQAERTIAGNTKKEAQELPSFVAYEQDGVLLEMAESIELKYKPRLEISEKLHDKVVSMLPDGVGLLSPIVSLTPEGEKFNPPIRCIFPASNGAAKAFRATAGRLEELEEAIFHGGYCEVSLDHFSCVFAVGSPLPLVATGYLRSESKVGKIVFCTLNCERCEKIVKHQKDFEEGVNSFRACGEPVVLGLTSLNESVKLLHDKTELKIEQVDPTCPRLPPFVSTDFLVGGPEPENGAFTIQVERDSTVTYKHLFQFSFPTLHAEPQASSSSTGPNQMVPLVLGMPQRTHLMLSGRFSTPEKCEYMKSLKGVLEGKGVHCYLVEAGPGDEFGFQTMEGLACAKAMLAVCCEEYGAYTGAGYETYYEVKYAWDHKLPIIPLRLCEVYPPQPERAGAIQNGFVFHKSLVRIEGRGRSIQEVAVDIEKAWKRIAKLTQDSLSEMD